MGLVKRTARVGGYRGKVPAWVDRLLQTGEPPADGEDGCEDYVAAIYFSSRVPGLEDPAYRAELVAQWIEDHPGTRPACWWREAPEPRRRIGGTGTPTHEALRGYAPSYRFGIPHQWVADWMPDYYTGKARDVDGKPIGQEFKGRKFAGVPVDPADPPVYESQAAYLKRLSLLVEGEAERLTDADFAPEAVQV